MPPDDLHHDRLAAILADRLPPVVRWTGAMARRLRQFDIGLAGKASGSASTDALTVADLAVQEVLVAALRDADPSLRRCRLDAEERTGDLARFAAESGYAIALDPIDGTRQYRDRVGTGYAVMLSLRSAATVHYSLVFVPESGPHGTWIEARGDRVAWGGDDPARSAPAVLRGLPAVPRERPAARRIYVIGFQARDGERARQVTATGLEGIVTDALPGSVYELLARGELGGSLIHTPNVYDFPVALHIARLLGGDAVWVHDRRPVHFGTLWRDERADMLRLPGIVACSPDRRTLDILCDLARDWNPERYAD